MTKSCYKNSFSHGAFNFYPLKAGSYGVLLSLKNVVKMKAIKEQLLLQLISFSFSFQFNFYTIFWYAKIIFILSFGFFLFIIHSNIASRAASYLRTLCSKEALLLVCIRLCYDGFFFFFCLLYVYINQKD